MLTYEQAWRLCALVSNPNSLVRPLRGEATFLLMSHSPAGLLSPNLDLIRSLSMRM